MSSVAICASIRSFTAADVGIVVSLSFDAIVSDAVTSAAAEKLVVSKSLAEPPPY